MNIAFTKKFDDVKSTMGDAIERGTELKENRGLYKLELTSITAGETKKESTPYIKLAFKVVESSGEGAIPAGATCVRMLYSDRFNYDLKEYIRFASSLLNTPVSKLTKDITDELTSASNPAAGKFVLCEVVADPKNEKYTKVRWSAAPTN